jgi:hypothetical protein
MQRAVDQVVPKRAQRAVDVRFLPAAVTIVADQHAAAVEAVLLMRAAVGFARRGLDGAADDSAGDRVANRFQFPHLTPSAGY